LAKSESFLPSLPLRQRLVLKKTNIFPAKVEVTDEEKKAPDHLVQENLCGGTLHKKKKLGQGRNRLARGEGGGGDARSCGLETQI